MQCDHSAWEGEAPAEPYFATISPLGGRGSCRAVLSPHGLLWHTRSVGQTFLSVSLIPSHLVGQTFLSVSDRLKAQAFRPVAGGAFLPLPSRGSPAERKDPAQQKLADAKPPSWTRSLCAAL